MTLELSEMALSVTEDSSIPVQTDEDHLVAELELLGIAYLSRHRPTPVDSVRAPHELLSDLIRQPSARVRGAIIAVLLLHPELANAIPAAMSRLSQADQLTLRVFYTASVILQAKYAPRLQLNATSTQPLPDLFSLELGLLRSGSPSEQLAALGRIHRRLSGSAVNWVGTYDNVAQHLMNRLERERLWNL
jgi:hypothetical protein